MNRMFRRACGALLSCVCVIWHGRLDASVVIESGECQPQYSGFKRGPQTIGIERGVNEWYVGYDTTGMWMNESRSSFTECIKMLNSHSFKACSINSLAGRITTVGSTFEKRCIYPYDKNIEVYLGTGTAIPFSCMINSDEPRLLYASSPKIFEDYGCTSGVVGGPDVPCLYTKSQSGVAHITFYPKGQSNGSASNSGDSNSGYSNSGNSNSGNSGSSADSLTGVTVSSMSVPYIKYIFKGCYTNAYWDDFCGDELPSYGADTIWYAHPSKINDGGTTAPSGESLEEIVRSMYNACYRPGGFFLENTDHHMSGETIISSGSAVTCCDYCPSGTSDLENTSTLFGNNTATLYVKEQADRVGIESCSLNTVAGTDSNNKGTVRYSNCTNYKEE